jgi:hypothetical protein
MPGPKKPDSPTPDTMIKRGDIGKYLGVGWRVVARLLKEGKIKLVQDPLDHRRKLVRTRDLDRLKQTSLKDD